MWCLVSKLIATLCIAELFKVASKNQKFKSVDIIDNFIGLAEPLSRSDIEKRNSIVDGGVFVPYKSTNIVYKSRIVPVTYGFVIKKEALKENPSLYKLGVKLLDEKVEPIPKQVLDEKKVESAPSKPLLDAKSNCVEGSKVLKLLAKLSKDINNIENAILAQNQSIESKREKFISTSQKITKEKYTKLHPQHEVHESGHKGVFENELNKNNKSQKHAMSKNLSTYWQCRRSHTRKKCAVLLLMKHARAEHHHGTHPASHTNHHKKIHRKHPDRFKIHERQHQQKNNKDHKKHSLRLKNRKNIFRRKRGCKNCKVKHRHKKRKYRQSNLRSTMHPQKRV